MRSTWKEETGAARSKQEDEEETNEDVKDTIKGDREKTVSTQTWDVLAY